MKRIIFTVTNDLSYDQRMMRITQSLSAAGYAVSLVGRRRPRSIPLTNGPVQQHRIPCFFEKGILFYVEFNIKLLFYLLQQKADIICAIDLDTILPCYWASKWKKIPRVYDAHELFTEQIEVISRPFIHRCWLAVERFAVPRFQLGYTVNAFIATELNKRYGVNYAVIRNLPVRTDEPLPTASPDSYILYQGSVNHGRCFETLIPAMKDVPVPLWICGEGNFMDQTKALIEAQGLTSRILLKQYIPPALLSTITRQAAFGLTLFTATGLNQYQSLANRFFDYMMAGIPQVCVDYPQYRAINDQYGFALLIPDTDTATIAAALNKLRTDTVLYERLSKKAREASCVLNWQQESTHLLQFYGAIQQHG